jgi:hypothetical protein
MELTYTVKIDLEETMHTVDAEPFCDFGAGDWQNYINEQLLEKLLALEIDCGAIASLINEEGNTLS